MARVPLYWSSLRIRVKGEGTVRLCDRDIEAWLNDGRLSITPHPSVEHISGVTVDIHLGNKFRTFSSGYNTPFIDLSMSKDKLDAILNSRMVSIELEDSEVFCLHPGELALAVTLESITLPANLVGWLDGRSSLARHGLMIHVTAHRIDPGWSGCIVLEFFNASKLSVTLRPGMVIGALSFELLMKPCMRPYNLRRKV